MRNVFILLSSVLLSGCVTSEPPTEAVVDPAASMEFLEEGLRPEILLFPDYFLMEDFELNQHGRIPGSSLVGGGLKAALPLTKVRGAFSDVLAAHGWNITKVEIGKSSCRIMASLEESTVEIRAVQGSGPVEVFLLYQPGYVDPSSLSY